jgi:hypothetical protein
MQFNTCALLMLSYRHRDSAVQADHLTRRHQVRVLAGPPLLINFMVLWHWEQGIGVPCYWALRGELMAALRESPFPETAEMNSSILRSLKTAKQQDCDL